MNLNFIALIINSLITGVCGGYIFYSIYIRRIEKHPFYYLFGVGFIIYSIEIFARAIYPTYFFYEVLMLYGSLLLFTIGLWAFTRKKIFLVITVAIYSVLFLLTFAWPLNLVPDFILKIGTPLGTMAYVPLILLILHHRFHFGKVADKFVFGWFLLFLANFATFGIGWITDLFVSFSKLVLLLGIRDYDFIVLAQRIREESLFKSLPTDVGYGIEGGLKLIFMGHSFFREVIKWVESVILENIKKGFNTFIFSFQDVVPHKELRRIKWINPEKVSIFLFSSSAEKAKEEFIVLPMSITQIGAALSEVIKKNTSSEECCTIFFIDLSLLIHVFGAHSVYNMLLNKTGALREGKVNLYAFLYPETHSDKSIVSLFASISDEVIKL